MEVGLYGWNKLQKIILVIGAIAFAVVMWKLPRMTILSSSGHILASGHRLDVGAAFVRAISDLVVVAALFFVAKTRKRE